MDAISEKSKLEFFSLFCEFCDSSIPMLLTKHKPTPNFQTLFISDRVKHYRLEKFKKAELK